MLQKLYKQAEFLAMSCSRFFPSTSILYMFSEHGGNSGGKSCVFPFVYKNQTFYTCTKEEKGRFWCATTRNYDKDLEWSYCADTSKNKILSAVIICLTKGYKRSRSSKDLQD